MIIPRLHIAWYFLAPGTFVPVTRIDLELIRVARRICGACRSPTFGLMFSLGVVENLPALLFTEAEETGDPDKGIFGM